MTSIFPLNEKQRATLLEGPNFPELDLFWFLEEMPMTKYIHRRCLRAEYWEHRWTIEQIKLSPGAYQQFLSEWHGELGERPERFLGWPLMVVEQETDVVIVRREMTAERLTAIVTGWMENNPQASIIGIKLSGYNLGDLPREPYSSLPDSFMGYPLSIAENLRDSQIVIESTQVVDL